MTSQQSVIWFVANAILIVTVLTVGTLGAADLLTRRGRAAQKASMRPVEVRQEPGAGRAGWSTVATGGDRPSDRASRPGTAPDHAGPPGL